MAVINGTHDAGEAAVIQNGTSGTLSVPGKVVKNALKSNINILDIRGDQNKVKTSLKDDILSMLRPEKGPKTMPTLLLYDERGLQLFEEVRRQKTPPNFEIWLLTQYRSHMRRNIT